MAPHVSYRTIEVDGLSIFYREAGPKDAPTPEAFSYTFDNIAAAMYRFTEALNLAWYTLYMQDYGGPVGFRMALTRPDPRTRSPH